MNLPYEWQIGWRYLRGGRSAAALGRRNRFIGFIAGVSMLGIALGVAALIVVLSVMNGFQKEVRDRMLDVLPHVELHDATGRGLPDWRALAAQAEGRAGARVRAASPFVALPVLVGQGDTLRGALLRGIEPEAEARVTALAARLSAAPAGGGPAPFAALRPGARAVVLGRELARLLEVKPGDTVGVVVPAARPPGGGAGAAGPPGASGSAEPSTLPSTTPFTVVAIFDAGHYEYDSTLVFVHRADAAALTGLDAAAAAGVALALDDALAAPTIAIRLARSLDADVIVRDWTQANRTWFEAVALQKRMLGLILVLIVAVAAFNLVSTLVMTVTDKRADIAILRTLGATPRSIMGIFFVQGAAAGVAGTAGGVLLGLAIALNLGHLVPALERALGTKLLPASVYFIDRMPSLPLASDIVPIAFVSVLLAFAATLYPSWRASRVQPAVELRGE